jgi:hypothetical protein
VHAGTVIDDPAELSALKLHYRGPRRRRSQNLSRWLANRGHVQYTREVTMGDRLTSMVTLAVTAAALSAAISVLAASAQAPASSNTALKTPWGEPDLQRIWTEEFDTPLQRTARFGSQEFFTETQREELDHQRGAHYGNDPRQERGSAVDVRGAYNTTFLTIKHAGARTSMIVDLPNGRLPPPTPTVNFSSR